MESRAIARNLLLITALLAAGAEARNVPFVATVVDSDIPGIRGLAAADVDGDGDLDILASATGTDEILWVENVNGQASSWTTHVVDSSFNLAFSIDGGDIDGDGDVDLVGAANSDSDVTWWENTMGDGSMWTRRDIDTAFGGAAGVRLADINADGHLDVLAVGSVNNDVAFFENTNGLGTSWTERTIDGSFNGAMSVVAGDIDGDGDLDVAAAGQVIDQIAWWENTMGDGTAWTKQIVDVSFNAAISVAIADVDGDGDLDLLGAAEDDNEIAWYENQGPASFQDRPFGRAQTWVAHPIDSTFGGAYSVYGADIDGDGDVDVVGAARNDNDIAWYENTAGDGSAWTDRTVASNFPNTRFVSVADLDKDGDMDFYASAVNISEISWWENETVHRSGAYPQENVLDSSFNGAAAAAVGDLDGDGDNDIAGVAEDGDEVAWWRNDGGSFTKTVLPGSFDGPVSVELHDLDGDGDLEVLGAASAGNQVAYWDNNGSFTQSSIDTLAGVTRASGGDVDGDGDVDVIAVSPTDEDVVWYANDGAGGTWTKNTINAAFSSARSAVFGDVDGDGDLDAVGMSSSPGNQVVWWENEDGDGLMWSAATSIDAAFSDGLYVAVADLDCDGDLDVLGASAGSGVLHWWENTAGNGSAWTGRDISCPACGDQLLGARFVATADLDVDGDLDVLGAGDTSPGRLHWYENVDGDGLTFTLGDISSAFDGATGAAAGDIDRDGDLDVVAAAAVADDLVVFDNLGGQFALPTADLGGSLGDSVTAAVLEITAEHNGRTGDPDIELTSLELLFEQSDGVPLNSTQANNVIENLFIYHDTGDESFDAGTDTLVTMLGSLSLTAGVETVPFADGDAEVQVAVGTTELYFVVLETTSDYSSQALGSLQVTHVTEASSTGDDADHDIALILESTANETAGPYVVNPSAGDADATVAVTDSVDPVDAGSAYSYTVAVTNNGPGPAENVSVALSLSGPATFVSTSGGCSEDPSGLPTCSLGSIAATETVNITVNVTANAGVSGTATLDASVSTTTADSNSGNDSDSQDTTVQNVAADVSVLAGVSPTHFEDGMTVRYFVVVSNNGPLAANGTLVNDDFPAEVTGLTWTCSGTGGGTCTSAGSGDLVSESVDLPVGATVRFIATGTATGTSDFTNTASATVTGDLVDPVPSNNSDDAPSIAVSELTFFGDFEEEDCSDWTLIIDSSGINDNCM